MCITMDNMQYYLYSITVLLCYMKSHTTVSHFILHADRIWWNHSNTSHTQWIENVYPHARILDFYFMSNMQYLPYGNHQIHMQNPNSVRCRGCNEWSTKTNYASEFFHSFATCINKAQFACKNDITCCHSYKPGVKQQNIYRSHGIVENSQITQPAWQWLAVNPLFLQTNLYNQYLVHELKPLISQNIIFISVDQNVRFIYMNVGFYMHEY
jgi:hypothetical protein